jgi:K+-transporting ATPase ATPase C chain
MRRELLIAIRSMIVIAILFGLGYPFFVTGVAQVAFPGKANGSLIRRGGVVVGSALIGQQFYENEIGKNGKVVMSKGAPVTVPDPRYFQTRPSGTSPADNDAATTFANYGPNSVLTKQVLQANIAAYIALNGPYYAGLDAARVPVDAADTSASGVDPDISVANARIQAHRIAAVRHLTLARVDGLIAQYTTGRSLGLFGEPGVNVLELNLALDRTSNAPGSK